MAGAPTHVDDGAPLSLSFKSYNETIATQNADIENVSRHEGGKT